MLTRQKEFFQWLAGGFMTAGLIVGGVYVTEHQHELFAFIPPMSSLSSTTSASQSDEKSRKLNPSDSQPGPEGKGGGQMSVTVTGARPEAQGPFVLTAKVYAQTDLTDVRFEWMLPDEVTIAKGSPAGTLGTLTEGGVGEIDLSINAHDLGENKQIHLQVYRIVDGERMGQIAQYNTVEPKGTDVIASGLLMHSDREPSSEPPRRME